MKEIRIVNEDQAGAGVWFDEFAHIGARAWNGSVSEDFSTQAVHYPGYIKNGRRRFHELNKYDLFIPFFGMVAAGDKRIQAHLFNVNNVPTPETHLVKTETEVTDFLRDNNSREWILKYPTGLATRGHTVADEEKMVRLTKEGFFEKMEWPKPFVVQEFIRHENPEIYRTYCVDGDVFAWNVRRFPDGVKPKDLVAHAVGARYFPLEEVPNEAKQVSKQALQAVKLFDSFGVVDLIKSQDGGLLVLEVGTDGIDTIVDRDFDNPDLTQELNGRIKDALQKRARLV